MALRSTRHATLVTILVPLLLLGGCGGKRPPVDVVLPPAGSPPPALVSPAAPERNGAPTQERAEDLYARLQGHVREYEAGIEMIAAGLEVLGEEVLGAAGEGIRRGAEACSALQGCDAGRFFTALTGLLARQSIALKSQASRIEELQASIDEQEVEREPGTSPFVAAMPEVGRTVALLRGTDLRDVITLNGPVQAALDDWLTWMRPLLMNAYANYQFLRSRMAPIYEEAGLPEALLFGFLATETGGKVHAYSRAGAAGPLQFMRRTGRRYGLTVQDGFDLRLDPEAATRANVLYLNEQFETLNNDLEKALAAYNGGENRMRVLSERMPGVSFWDSRMYYSLPRETREYVPRILAAAWLFLHPEDYNLEFPRVSAETTRLVLQDALSLGELTICLGQAHNPDGWFRTLRNLNPRLEPAKRIEAGDEIVVPSLLVPVYEERCQTSELLARARELHDANYAEGVELIRYRVRRGDTLGKIAARFHCVSIGELADINRIRPPKYVIHVGQMLKIPACG